MHWIRPYDEVSILQYVIRNLGVFHELCIEEDDQESLSPTHLELWTGTFEPVLSAS